MLNRLAKPMSLTVLGLSPALLPTLRSTHRHAPPGPDPLP